MSDGSKQVELDEITNEGQQEAGDDISHLHIRQLNIEVPNGWKEVGLGEIGRLDTSSVNKKSNSDEETISLVNYMDVYGNYYINSDIDYMKVTAPESHIERSQVSVGDILFTPSSEEPGDIGNSAVVTENMEKTLHSYHTVRLRPETEKIALNTSFSGWVANAPYVSKQFARRATGSTRYTLTLGDFADTRVLVPSLSEQRKIATVLHNVDQAIQKTEKIIEQTKRIGKGLRASLFTEGYYEHEIESHGTLGDVPADWEKTRLYKISNVARGKFTHRPRNDPDFYDGEYPFIQTGEVVEAEGELTDYSQTLNERGKGVSKEFDPGTIIITIAGNIGDTAVATFPVYFPDSLVGITPNEGIDEYFLEHFLRYRQDFLNRLSTKTTQKNLNLTLLRPIEVVKPPLEEQKEIAQLLTTIDDKIKKEREYKHHLTRTKQGLMQDLLSGTVRTTDTNIEVPDEIAQHG